jgi:hypothetical protein
LPYEIRLWWRDVKFVLMVQVHVQSDPAGRLVITGDPDQPDNNPWGITPFKKVKIALQMLT